MAERGDENAESIGFSSRDSRGPLPSPEPTDRTVRESVHWSGIVAQLRQLDAMADALLLKQARLIKQRALILAHLRNLPVKARDKRLNDQR